jgi:hypothetical protein
VPMLFGGWDLPPVPMTLSACLLLAVAAGDSSSELRARDCCGVIQSFPCSPPSPVSSSTSSFS